MGTDAREHGDAHARPERVRQVDGLQSALARTRQDLLRVRDHEHFIGVRRRRGRVRRRLRRLGRSPHYTNDDSLELLLRSHGAEVVNLASEPRGSAIFERNGAITLCTDTRAVMVLSDGYDRPANRPPGWLDCFRSPGRAVKESYIEALAAAGFNFDRVPLGPHLAYDLNSRTPRPV